MVRAAILVLVLVLTACGSEPHEPEPPSTPTVDWRPHRLLTVGAAHWRQGHVDGATTAFRTLRDVAPDEPAAIVGLAVLALEAGDLDRASLLVDRGRRMTSRRGNVPELHLVAHHLGRSEGLRGAALGALETAAEAAADDPYLALAAAEAAVGWRKAMTRRQMRRALRLADGDPGVEVAYARWACDRRDEYFADCLPRIYELMRILDPIEGPEAFGRAARDMADRAAGDPLPETVELLLESLETTPERARTRERVAEASRLRVPSRLYRARTRRRAAPDELGPPITFTYEPVRSIEGGPIDALIRVEHGAAPGGEPPPSGYLLRSGEWLLFARGPLPCEPTFVTAVGAGASVTVADVDGDPESEVLVLDDEGVRVFHWERGEFVAGEALGDVEPGELVVHDYDGDGDHDLLRTRPRRPAVLLENRRGFRRPTGEVRARPLGPPQAPRFARGIAAVDFDGDAAVDLAYVTGGGITFARSIGGGRYEVLPRASRTSPSGPPTGPPLSVRSPRAGRRDVLVPSDGRLEVYTASARNEYGIRGTPSFRGTGLERAAGAVTADIDLDGYEEVVLWGDRSDSTVGTTRFGVWTPGSFRGRYEDGAFYAMTFRSDGAVEGLLPVDVDDDGDLDLLGWTRAAGATAADLFVLRNEGAEDQGRSRISLHGAPGGAGDGRGVRIDVFRGGRVETSTARGPRITVGWGDERPYLVRATWTDGATAEIVEPGPGPLALVHP